MNIDNYELLITNDDKALLSQFQEKEDKNIKCKLFIYYRYY